MKNSILLLLSILFIQCGSSDKKTTADIIASASLEDIQAQKTTVVKQINQLQEELVALNTAIGKLDAEQKFLLVTVVELKEENYQHFVQFQGTIDTDKNVLLYPEIPAILETVTVEEGQAVKAGQTLASLSDSGLEEQLDQLRLQADLAATTYERQKRLWEKKIGSEMQFLQAKTAHLQLQKSIAQMEEQVAKTEITAPFEGLVDHILQDPGSNVAPGMTPLFRVINLDQMKVSAEIPEKHLPNIQKNTKVEVIVPVLGKTLEASVSSVGNFINPNNRSFRVEIQLDNPEGNLKPNMTAQLNINDYQNPNAVLVASKNILEDQNGNSYVYKITPAEGQEGVFKAVKTAVVLGKSSGDFTEIVEGITAEDQIIEEGLRLVEDQQLVKIIQ